MKNVNWGLVIGGLAVLATIYYGRKALAKVGEAAQAVNPLNHDNVFNEGATRAAQAVGLVDENSTIGGTIFEGIQRISSWFGGGPTDDEILAQQPQLPSSRLRAIDDDNDGGKP